MKTLGIDIGTTSISLVLCELEERRVLKAWTLKNDIFLTSPKIWEKIQDPGRIMTIVSQAIEEIQREVPDIGYIGITGQMHGILYVNQAGEAISPLYTWQDGTGDQPYREGKSYAEHLNQLLGAKFATGFGGVTLYAHARRGEIPREAVSFCTIGDYLGMQLTRRKSPLMDITNAASLGFYDNEKQGFRRKDIEVAGLDYEFFPRVSRERKALGRTKDGIPVGLAIGDNQASFMGALSDRENSVLVNIGTGSQISFLVDSCEEIPGMEIRPFAKDQYLAVHSGLCGGRAYAILEAFIRQLLTYFGVEASKEDVYQQMEQMARAKSPKAGELIVKPFFSGTRENAEIRGEITGLDLTNFMPEDLVQGMIMGIIDELYDRYKDTKTARAGKLQALVGSGNGIRCNPVMQKLISERFGLPLIIPDNKEEAASGVAFEVM
ncbi:sedoheptulokinase [Lachnospiraceae bacterium PF1-21]